ncbi:MAG TPA: hypothetical protein VG889_09530 [Rhizomicrobium sp.]|nr:hypothetical protein [Rhizomicrobium sp.]
MEPISNADRLVLLLKQKLEERSKTSRGGGKARAGGPVPVEPMGVRALAAIEGADERSLRRAIIQNLLAEQLDPSLLNDAQFQQIVTRVTDAIEDDRDASALMARVIADLKKSSG